MSNKMSLSDRKYVDKRLAFWGVWVSSSVNDGYPGRNPIVDMIEYHMRVTGGVKRVDAFGPYERDEYNSTTNQAVLELSDEQYKMVFFEYAWQHIDKGDSIVIVAGVRAPLIRRPLTRSELLHVLDMSKASYHRKKADYFRRVYDYIEGYRGMRAVNRLDII